MQIVTITLSFDTETGQFEEKKLNELLKNKHVEKISEHFFASEGKPYITFVIYYTIRNYSESVILKEEDLALYEKLRIWRNTTAKNLGFSPYIVLNNNQLKQIVQKMPKYLEELKEIGGVGHSRVEKYGRDILNIVEEFRAKNEKQS